MQLKKLLFVSAVALLAFGFAPAQAQVFNSIYPTKVACGFVPGNVPPLAGQQPFVGIQPNTDRDQEPGHYATIVNVLQTQFANNSVVAFFVQDGQPGVGIPLNTAVLGAFRSLDVGCTDIAPFIGLGGGAPFEGWLVIAATQPTLEVSPVYTFESQNGFAEHRVHQVLQGGQRLQLLNVPPANPFDLFVPGGVAFVLQLALQTQAGDVHVSGAGGLGVGASIDVETVDAVALVPPMFAPDLDAAMTEPGFGFNADKP